MNIPRKACAVVLGWSCASTVAMSAVPSPVETPDACRDPAHVLATLQRHDLPGRPASAVRPLHPALSWTRSVEIRTACVGSLREVRSHAAVFTHVYVRPALNGMHARSVEGEDFVDRLKHRAAGPDGELLAERHMQSHEGRDLGLGLWRSADRYRITYFTRIPGAPRPAASTVLLELDEPVHSINYVRGYHSLKAEVEYVTGDQTRFQHHYVLDLERLDPEIWHWPDEPPGR